MTGPWSFGSRIDAALRACLQPLGYSLEPTTAPRLALLADPLLRLAGVRMTTYRPHPGFGYVKYQTTVAAAEAANLSIPAYLAKLWNEEGTTESIVDRIAQAIPFERCRNILEVGAGAGRTLDIVHARARPETYEIYEPDTEWAAYLVKQYGVIDRQADGVSLTPTPSESCDLVQAHGVFVYLPLVNAFQYFKEMSRVCRPGGWIVFDMFADDRATLTAVEDWMSSGQGFHVLLPRRALVDLFAQGGGELKDQFEIHEHCEYLIFQKRP